ncbi:MAG: CapA family protein [Patescibacteria group bacterium]
MNGKLKIDRIHKIVVAISLFIAISVSGFFYIYKTDKTFSYNAKKGVDYSQVKILIFGDMMLDRNVSNNIKRIGFDKFFAGMKDMITDADIAVVNLEGPFTDYPSITTSLKNRALQFTFDPTLAPKLAELGFDILGLANNHTLNFGKSGLEQTRRYIGNAGMIYYGEPFNKDEISTIITKNGIKIAFVGFHEFNYINFENIFAEIKKLRPDVDILIVTPHWGVEYQKEPTVKMTELAQSFIDSGADMVIGAHPHIIGDIGIYKGKKIYYSLGNFVFDQYFSEETMKGLAVIIDIKKVNNEIGIDYTDISTRIDRDGVRVEKK